MASAPTDQSRSYRAILQDVKEHWRSICAQLHPELDRDSSISVTARGQYTIEMDDNPVRFIRELALLECEQKGWNLSVHDDWKFIPGRGRLNFTGSFDDHNIRYLILEMLPELLREHKRKMRKDKIYALSFWARHSWFLKSVYNRERTYFALQTFAQSPTLSPACKVSIERFLEKISDDKVLMQHIQRFVTFKSSTSMSLFLSKEEDVVPIDRRGREVPEYHLVVKVSDSGFINITDESDMQQFLLTHDDDSNDY